MTTTMVAHPPLPSFPGYPSHFPPIVEPVSTGPVRQPFSRDRPLYVDTSLSHSCWEGVFGTIETIGTKERFVAPGMEIFVRNWQPYSLELNRQYFSETHFASEPLSIRRAQSITELLKASGVFAHVLFVSEDSKTASFKDVFGTKQARILVPSLEKQEYEKLTASHPAPLNQEVLDRAATYLRKIHNLPSGQFIVLGGKYYWGDASTPFTYYHSNVIKNFSEKPELGKSIRYVYPALPEGSKVKFSISAFYLNHGNETLILKRSENVATNSAREGIPGGKKEKGESDLEAALREAREETGIDLEKDFPAVEIETLKPVFVTLSPSACFLYSAYSANLPYKPTITIRPEEHLGYHWLTLQEARDKLGLIDGEEECFDLELERRKNQKMTHATP